VETGRRGIEAISNIGRDRLVAPMFVPFVMGSLRSGQDAQVPRSAILKPYSLRSFV